MADEIDPFDEPFDLAEEQDAQAYAELKKVLFDRCSKAQIAVEETSTELNENILTLSFPCGREKRKVYLYNTHDIGSLLSFRFEDFYFLGEYNAICQRSDNSIEAAIRYTGSRERLIRALSSGEEERSEGDDLKEFTLPSSSQFPDIKISIGPETSFLNVLTHTRARISLKITGCSCERHDNALEALEKLSNSIFFQIDRLHAITMGLLKRRIIIRKKKGTASPPTALSFPTHEYDKAPLSLYSYGRGALGLPLVQFLAFYQVIEFYFPICYKVETQEKIRLILKDPTFRADSESSLGRIVACLHASGSGGFADEKSMLIATIRRCIDPNELRLFLEENPSAAAHYKSKIKGLTDHKIPLDAVDQDIMPATVERIYDIRCRIVHTKASGKDGSFELLLPSSPEANLLQYDVELLQYLAKGVLIFGSSPLKL